MTKNDQKLSIEQRTKRNKSRVILATSLLIFMRNCHEQMRISYSARKIQRPAHFSNVFFMLISRVMSHFFLLCAILKPGFMLKVLRPIFEEAKKGHSDLKEETKGLQAQLAYSLLDGFSWQKNTVWYMEKEAKMD